MKEAKENKEREAVEAVVDLSEMDPPCLSGFPHDSLPGT